MPRIINKILVVVLGLLFLHMPPAHAQCPVDNTPCEWKQARPIVRWMTREVEVTVDGKIVKRLCRKQVRINACYRCCSSGSAQLEVRLVSVELVAQEDDCPWEYDGQFWRGVDNIMSGEAFYNNSYECAGKPMSCIQGGLPLCSDGPIFTVNLYRANCYRRDFTQMDPSRLFRLVPCKGSGECMSTWEICCSERTVLRNTRIRTESIGGCYELGATERETEECYPACY